MSQVVEDILDRHNLLNRPRKVALIDGIPRPKYYWERLRHSISSTVDAIKRSDSEDKVVSHGVHFRRDIQHEDPLLCGLYNKVTKEYLTLDDNYIYVYKSDGRKKDIIIPASIIERMIHASLVNLYVAWRPERQELYLMSSDLDMISESATGYDIICLVYNENNGEVVTSGAGVVSVWAFRYGARHLIPRATTTHNLTVEDQFSILVLEGTPQPTQQLFAVCENSVAVFHVGDCVLVDYHRELHPRPITAAIFFNPMKYLITGAKDGCIKIWTDQFSLQHVFIGHTGQVNCMSIYPYGSYFLSASADRSLRVWSLDLRDQVDVKETDDPIEGMGTALGEDCFYSHSGYVMKLWRLHHLHCELTTVGYRVNDIKHSRNPMFPIRSVLRCNDSSVRIVCPLSGDVLTTLLMPLQRNMIDMAYATEMNALFCVFANGDLLRAETTTNPCRVVGEWKYPDQRKVCMCLLVYEYIVNMWGAETRTQLPGTRDNQRGQKHQNKTLLLGGRKDGYLCVFDMETGVVDFEIEAHGRKGVRKMVANAKYDQLISAGADNIIKIWRVYPYAQEALAPLMSFFCAHLPVHMVMLKNRLCVAFQDHGTATYNIIVHDLENKDRHDHAPSCDHTDAITGLSCCQRLKIFASSSFDGTIRIWNENNELLRILSLSATPFCAGFCGTKGDIVVGVGEHLHFIDHRKFLPRQLLFRMVCMRFPTLHAESALPYDDTALERLSKLDLRRLKTARAAFRFDTFTDVMTEEEADEVLCEKRMKEKAFSLLGAREQELAMIRDGKLQSKPKAKPTRQTRNEAFDKYIKIFYDRPKVELPDEKKSIDQQMNEMLNGPDEPFTEKYIPEITTGFFPPPHTAIKPQVAAPDKPLEPPYRIAPDGFIPNSILTRLLWPEKEKLMKKEYRPPMMSEEQMARIARMNKAMTRAVSAVPDESRKSAMSTRSTDTDERAIMIDYDDDDDKIPDDNLGDEYTGALATSDRKESEEREPSTFMMKLKGVIEKPPSTEPEPIPEVTPTPLQARPESTLVSRAPTSTTVASVKSETKDIKLAKPIKKLVSKGPPAQPRLKTPPPKVPMKETERDPRARGAYGGASAAYGGASAAYDGASAAPATPPPEPLPDFILRCKGQDWFEKYFPNCSEHTLPKPWTVDAFTTMLLRVLRISEFPHKTGVCKALRTMMTQEGIPNTMIVRSTVLGILNAEEKQPSYQNEAEKEFIAASLYLLVSLQIYDKVTFSTIMVMYLEGDTEIRNQVKELFSNFGLQDARGLFYQEMDRWEIWSLDDKNPRKALAQMCDDWLDKWMTAFKMHVQDVIEQLKRGEGVHGKVGSKPAQKASSSKGILRKQDLEDPLSGTAKSITVTFDSPPDQSTVDSATYLEAINYFAEMERAKLLQQKRSKQESQGRDETPAGPKNTVLVLPKINKKTCLVRLGETHTSQCHPRRETSLHVDYKRMSRTSRGLPPMPGDLYGFTPAIVLPMKSIDMNPWLPQHEMPETMFVTLRLAPKYYIPEHSVIQRPGQLSTGN